ncbi:hypothetical protein [Sphingobacterium sp.]|uniref:hypothetical protein n=1 Tax=Sphingobacterium sp. TaxID=341027 RepID=UPI0028AE73C7|nr:hypothetical protein [Sphingobacterium sp.]
MLEILAGTLVMAMVTNMMMLVPIYNRLRKFGKPFSCSFCMGFWIPLSIGLFGLHDLSTLQWLFVTLASPFTTEMLKRLKDALPITI